ncbi:MAG TPA: class E sortase [Rubrobacteraceae bacterium]|nr:class E sortase [Rubrobacteraceae bacterium]
MPVVLFALLALPIIPQAESSSVDLGTAEVQTAGKLLGENAAPLAEPPESPPKTPEKAATGAAQAMTLTIPKLGIKDLDIPTAASQAVLDREGIIHLQNTGVPWQRGSNTFIVGHALGFMQTRVPYVFYKLDKMRPGDEISVKDTTGKEYVYRVYDLMTVRPADYWVTYPVAGKTTISLQTCTPIPTFENRLIVRGELVSG